MPLVVLQDVETGQTHTREIVLEQMEARWFFHGFDNPVRGLWYFTSLSLEEQRILFTHRVQRN